MGTLPKQDPAHGFGFERSPDDKHTDHDRYEASCISKSMHSPLARSITSGMSPDEIAHVIRNAIANGTYEPGQRLSQVELAQRFSVSRIPLREALRTLVAEGLLEHDKQKGTSVTALDPGRINEIYALRTLIEPSFASEVVRNMSPALIELLESRLAAIEAAGENDPDLWSQENFKFHLELYAIADLPIRYEVLSRLYYLLEPFSRMYVHNSGGRPRAESEHRQMISAIRDGNAQALADVILLHVQGGYEGLAESMAATSRDSEAVTWPGLPRSRFGI